MVQSHLSIWLCVSQMEGAEPASFCYCWAVPHCPVLPVCPARVSLCLGRDVNPPLCPSPVHALSQSVNIRGGSWLYHRCSSQLSYSCSYCLSDHADEVWLRCASPGQQSTQRPPSVAASIRLYQMLHGLSQPGRLRDELISSSTWCTEGPSRHPRGPASLKPWLVARTTPKAAIKDDGGPLMCWLVGEESWGT